MQRHTPPPTESQLAMHLRRRIVAPCTVLLLLALSAAGCSGSKKALPTETPTFGPSPTAAPSATPTLPPATLDEGASLRHDGSFEEAIRVYAAVAATPQPQPASQQDARLAQAQLLARTGRNDEARDALLAYLAAAGPAADGTAARYLLASVLDDLGDTPGALDSYERYIAANGAAVDFARIERAKLLARMGRAADANAAAEAVLASGVLPQYKASFVLSMGRAFEQPDADVAPDDADALAWYVRAETYPGADAGSALARAGAVRKRLGDAGWAADYLSAITSYPSAGFAPDLLDELDAAAIPVDDYTRGLVDYRGGRNDASRTALAAAVAASNHAAEAAYYLGALDERAGDDATAIDHYGQSYALDPASPVADDALWWRGRLLENAGRFDEAGQAYTSLADGFRASTWHDDAAFRRGLVQYKAANKTAAAQTWAGLATAATGIERQRAEFWQGKALKESDNDGDARTVLQQLIDDDAGKGDFYALRAEVLLAKNDTSDDDPQLDATEPPDWDAIAAYAAVSTPTAAAAPSPRSDPRWRLAGELNAVGLGAQSDAEVIAMFDDAKPEGLAAITRALYEDGRTSLAARGAVRLQAAVDEAPQTSPPTDRTPPIDLERIAYPAAYGDLMQEAASDEDISPLLLLSLVRQESFYDPDAGSGAGALGLTQVVPTTGESIADSLGVIGFIGDDLFRPNVSLRFGAHYLASQLRGFDGDAYHALAAYNGGPGAATDAIDAGGGSDPDLFVEDLEFDETQRYVRLVMENLARYRQLYAGVDRPSLAR
jgi:soluble lytic murein transglycosylase